MTTALNEGHVSAVIASINGGVPGKEMLGVVLRVTRS